MRFIKEDFQEKQRKKRMVMVYASTALLAVAIIWYAFIRTSPGPSGGLAAGEEQPPGPVTTTTVGGKTSPGEILDLPALVKRVKESIVIINTIDRGGNPLGQGSGFFVNGHGHVVSNRHVFRGAERAEVKSPKGTFTVKKILAEDAKNDLILVSLETTRSGFNPLPFAASDVQVGERIVVIGNPLGLDATVSDGIVSARRELDPFGKVIQLTSPISPGSSGSPVFNMQGEVIGVATFQIHGGQNLNFAIPVEKVHRLVSAQVNEKAVAELSFADSGILASAEDPLARGIIYYNAGEYDNAVKELQTAIKDDPTNAEIYFYLGKCYTEKQFTDAVDAFKRAVDLNPQYTEAYFHLGMVYNKLDMYREAIAALRQALQIEADHPGALLQIGIAYAMIKEYRAAVTMLEKAADMEMDARAYYALGISYAALNMASEAIQALQSAVDLDGEFLDAYIALGFAYAAVKNWRQGTKLLNRAVLVAPQSPAIRYLLGIMYLGSDDITTAERQYEILRNMKEPDSSKFANQLRNAINKYKAYKNRGYRGY